MTTIRAILFGDLSGPASQTVDDAVHRLASAGAMPHRREVAPAAIARSALARAAELLDIEVSDVLIGAWKTRSALLKAAKETQKKPGVYRQVTVRGYAFPWEYAVDFDVQLAGKKIGTVSFVAGVEVNATGLAVVIQNGAIVQVVAGDVRIGAALRIASRTAVPLAVPLAQGERTLPLSVELTVPGTGISLVD